METALLLWKQAAGGKSEGNVSVGVVRGEWSDPVSPARSGAPQTGHAHRPEFPTYLIWGLLQQRNGLKRQTSMKTTRVFCFFSLFALDRQKNGQRGKGKAKEMLEGIWGISSSDRCCCRVFGTLQKKTFSFYKTVGNTQGLFSSFFFRGGWVNWCKVVEWGISFISLFCEHFFHFRWLTKGLFSFFFFCSAIILSCCNW